MFKKVAVIFVLLKRVIIFLLIVILLGFLSIYHFKLTDEEDWKGKEYEKEKCFVNRVIDGDILGCNNETIRLFGIDNKDV